MLCNTVQGKMQSPLFSAALQKRLTAGSVSLQLHLWRFAAVTHHKCSATLFRAKCNPHCSVLLCKRGSYGDLQVCTAGQNAHLCSFALHSRQVSSDTYGDLLFIQVSSDSHMLCSKDQGKMQSPLFSAALQKRLTAGSVSLQLHLWRFALHTGVQ